MNGITYIRYLLKPCPFQARLRATFAIPPAHKMHCILVTALRCLQLRHRLRGPLRSGRFGLRRLVAPPSLQVPRRREFTSGLDARSSWRRRRRKRCSSVRR